VTIDTLRADRVGAYGYRPAQTPSLDRLGQRGVLVEDAVVQVPQTRPSHASFFTGRLPYEHGIRDNFSPPLDAAHPTLATLLKGQGYATGGFIGAYPVSRDSGLDRGFDVFDDPFGGGPGGGLSLERSARPAGPVVDAALEWLEAPRKQPFFAWVHVFDPHAPYEPPEPFASRFQMAPYDGEVAYADSQVGRLLAWVEASGQASRTLVVVTSDHGEGLGDHGEDEHQLFVYDSTLRVPLLLSWPGRLPSGRRVSGQFRSVDLLPTTLDLLGLPPTPTSGASRAAALLGTEPIPDNESYAESLFGQLHFGWAALRALRGQGWKYIDAPRAELYHLAEDPGETRNRLEERGQVASAMSARLRRFDTTGPPAATASVDPDAAERLAALGYVGGAFFTGTPSGVDPKDAAREYQAFHRETSRAAALFEKGDFTGVVQVLGPLAAPRRAEGGGTVRRQSFAVSYYLGRALLELKRFADAVEPLRGALRLSPQTPALFVALARAQAGAGRLEEALATIERGLELAPRHLGLLQMKGRVLLGRGAATAALAVLEEARGIDPRNALLRVDLANALREAGRPGPALAEAEEAARLDPRSAEAQVARGLCLGALGRAPEAEAAFRRALEAAPGNPDALFFLAVTQLKSGHSGEAAALVERVLRVAPGYPQARELLAAARAGAAPEADGRVHLRLLRVRERARAEEASRRARSGEDFASLARELSEHPSASRGGDLGLVRVEDLAAPLRAAAAALPAGGMSPVLPTGDGFVLLKRER
jgi:arylsulfatase A-like enzyme/tetratricopeptide (TPR) repeat protein